jgi:hypothetical protein
MQLLQPTSRTGGVSSLEKYPHLAEEDAPGSFGDVIPDDADEAISVRARSPRRVDPTSAEPGPDRQRRLSVPGLRDGMADTGFMRDDEGHGRAQ